MYLGMDPALPLRKRPVQSMLHPTKREAGEIQTTNIKTIANIISPTPVRNKLYKILPPPTFKEAGENPSTLKQYIVYISLLTPPKSKKQGTPLADWPDGLCCNDSSSDDITKNEECMICFPRWLHINANQKQIMDNAMKRFAQHL